MKVYLCLLLIIVILLGVLGIGSLTDSHAVLLTGIIGSITTVLLAILGWRENIELQAKINSTQFKHKIVYEGWNKIQKHSFKYASLVEEISLNTLSIEIGLNLLKFHSTPETFNVIKKNTEKLQKTNYALDGSFSNFKQAYLEHEIFYKPLTASFLNIEKLNKELAESHSNLISKLYLNLIWKEKNYEIKIIEDKVKPELKKLEDKTREIIHEINTVREHLQKITFSEVLSKSL